MSELTTLQVRIDRSGGHTPRKGVVAPASVVVEGITPTDRAGLAVTPHIERDGTPSHRAGYFVTHVMSGKRLGSRPMPKPKAIALMLDLYAMDGIDWTMDGALLKTQANSERVAVVLNAHGVWR